MTDPSIQDYLGDYRAASQSVRQQYTDAEGNVDYASLYGHTSGVLFGIIYTMTQSECRTLAERLDRNARTSDETISDETISQFREFFKTIDAALRQGRESK